MSFMLEKVSYDVAPNTSPIQKPNSTTSWVFSSCRQDADDYVMAVQVVLVLRPSCVPERVGTYKNIT
jgi:hypothetical protein